MQKIVYRRFLGFFTRCATHRARGRHRQRHRNDFAGRLSERSRDRQFPIDVANARITRLVSLNGRAGLKFRLMITRYRRCHIFWKNYRLLQSMLTARFRWISLHIYILICDSRYCADAFHCTSSILRFIFFRRRALAKANVYHGYQISYKRLLIHFSAFVFMRHVLPMPPEIITIAKLGSQNFTRVRHVLYHAPQGQQWA